MNYTHTSKASFALLTGNIIPCDGLLTRVEFFSISANYNLSFTVWRKTKHPHIINVVEIRSLFCDFTGFHFQDFNLPVAVSAGDFIGIEIHFKEGSFHEFPVPFAKKWESGLLVTDLNPTLYFHDISALASKLDLSNISAYHVEEADAAFAMKLYLMPGSGSGGLPKFNVTYLFIQTVL